MQLASLALPLGLAAVAAAAAVLFQAWARGTRRARERVEAARAEAKLAVKSGRLEAAALRRAAETEAREQALERRAAAEQELGRDREALARRSERASARENGFGEVRRANEQREAEVTERQREVRAAEDRARDLRQSVGSSDGDARALLERQAGTTAAETAARMAHGWLEDARAEAAQSVRGVDQNAADPEIGRRAKRLMEIAISRYKGHFLTERAISNVPLGEGVGDLLVADGQRLLGAVAEGANIQLHLNDTGDMVKLEGLDGVGREVARRALARLARKAGASSEAERDPAAWVGGIRTQLDQEIQGLGRKAFSVLQIPRAHAEIVTLVGRLNYRTSYTQNQWLHAVEASFLAGMMASEMGLDIKLARRATLMHDIGKALTHEIDGSHAVIGADIARRLGEQEVVANAIGAHHADEPPNSIYAFLVAAADAMSGARPGARREHPEGYSTKLEDLERIGGNYPGVERCFAVHGGRELRVYVREREISDLQAVELSSEIAAQISNEMTFPGQIKVTVIRSTEAVSVAS
ncbi:MAG TPA: Rnase Y domain-containing protein [Kofleriaceae bacterium]|nr:Rnase Y domain-containing protein [Kofleriaceae bacterium]